MIYIANLVGASYMFAYTRPKDGRKVSGDIESEKADKP
jgi:hypothetical protein